MREEYLATVIRGLEVVEGRTYSEDAFKHWSDEELRKEAGWYNYYILSQMA